jgi:hypothetical protein
VPLGGFELGVGFENATSHPAPGDILFYPGGYGETEIIMAYGACCFASKLGQLAGNHFLSIVEGREQLRALVEKVLWQGAQAVRFVSRCGRGLDMTHVFESPRHLDQRQ